MNNERKTGISAEEIEENGLIEDENDFLYPADEWGEGCCEDEFEDDDEPREREYCD